MFERNELVEVAKLVEMVRWDGLVEMVKMICFMGLWAKQVEFLAAMSSSRSDVVTQFVRVFVFSCVPFFLVVS